MDQIDEIELMLTTQLERIRYDLTLGKQNQNIWRQKIKRFIEDTIEAL